MREEPVMRAPADEPRGPEGPPRDLAPTEEVGLRRHLFFGLALLLAFGSMYSGVLNLGRVVQYGLAVGALVAVLVAMTMRATPRRPEPPPGGEP
jgi:hypothetical protein